jgi:hypothetical protein
MKERGTRCKERKIGGERAGGKPMEGRTDEEEEGERWDERKEHISMCSFLSSNLSPSTPSGGQMELTVLIWV